MDLARIWHSNYLRIPREEFCLVICGNLSRNIKDHTAHTRTLFFHQLGVACLKPTSITTFLASPYRQTYTTTMKFRFTPKSNTAHLILTIFDFFSSLPFCMFGAYFGWCPFIAADVSCTQDRHMKRNGDNEPFVDPSQDYTLLLGYENSTHTVLRFKRKLDTCDTSHDIPITVRIVFPFLFYL